MDSEQNAEGAATETGIVILLLLAFLFCVLAIILGLAGVW